MAPRPHRQRDRRTAASAKGLEALRPTRRRFLGYMAATGAALVGLEAISRRVVPLTDAEPVFTLIPTFRTNFRRPDDLLSLQFDFYNLLLDASDPVNPKLIRVPGSKFAYVVANFWPQNVAEEAFLEQSSSVVPPDPTIPPQPPLPPPPVKSLLAGQSRLAFVLPGGMNSVDLTPDTLLRWAGLGLQPLVVPAARTDGPRNKSALREPDAFETCIELPWRLVLSPHEKSKWQHSLLPVAHNNRLELWHTRLVIGPDREPQGMLDEPDPALRTIRAVWALDPDFPSNLNQFSDPADDTLPFRMSLDERDRFDIVVNTTIDIPGVIGDLRGYKSKPVNVDRLMLSAVGAWIDSDGRWEGNTKPYNNSLEEWRQRGTMGRDHYVRIVRKGYLFPYGHPASLIKITERKFNFARDGTLGAFLRQRYFIVVRRPEKIYGDPSVAPRQPFAGRPMPFPSMRFTTLVTPILDWPPPPPTDSKMFIPRVGGEPYLFHVVGTDRRGVRSEFTTPVYFVDLSIAFGDDPLHRMANLVSLYPGPNPDGVAPNPDSLFDVGLQGQNVNVAEVTDELATAVQVDTLTFGAVPPEGGINQAIMNLLKPFDQPPFYPAVKLANIRLLAAEQVRGTPLGSTAITIATEYIQDGFNGPLGINRGQFFARLVSTVPLSFAGGADKGGGVMTPNISIAGLSRSLGPVGDAAGVLMGKFDPEPYFKGLEAKILGGIDLFEILNPAALDPSGPAGPDSLKINTDTLFDDGKTSPPTALVTTLDWHPSLTKDEPLHIFNPDDGAAAKLNVQVRTDLKNAANSDYKVVGDLQNFTVKLFGDGSAPGTDLFHVIEIQFNRLRFTAQKGKKSNVDVDIQKVAFVGVLKFVEELKDYLKSLGTGPSLDIEPSGILAGFQLAIPEVGVGVFTLAHLQLSTAVNLPFSGNPARVRFAFCTRENPFTLTVTFLGGGGFFGLALGTDGFEMVEAALEFGAAASINLGVASGEVHIMVGIYFKLEEEPQGQDTTLSGYFRMGGELCVLGIISVSLEFYMSFTYESATNKVTGQATLTVEVKVLFVSKSVDITVERKFGGHGDPTFLDAVPDQDTWNEYVGAFAPVAA